MATTTHLPAKPAGYPAPFRLRGTFDQYLAGTVGYAYVSFRDRSGGKSRPVVVVSATDTHLYVRALYSNPSRCAGGWRATLLGLDGSGLDHPGYLHPDTVRIRRDSLKPIGRISLHDWNLLRVGCVARQVAV